MTSSGLKLLIAILLLPSSILLMRVTGWFGLLFIMSLICSILFCFDYAGELRLLEHKTKYQKIISGVLLLPQALFGLISFLIGISIALWVLYNTFIETQSEYSGGFLTFGVAPALIIFGLVSLKSIFIKEESCKNEP